MIVRRCAPDLYAEQTRHFTTIIQGDEASITTAADVTLETTGQSR